MKFRLLKDLSDVKAGETLIPTVSNKGYEIYGTLFWIPKELVENNPEWFAPIDERWKPEALEKYWFIDNGMNIWQEDWREDSNDKYRFKAGNVFKNRKQCESAALRVKELLLSIHKEKAND